MWNKIISLIVFVGAWLSSVGADEFKSDDEFLVEYLFYEARIEALFDLSSRVDKSLYSIALELSASSKSLIEAHSAFNASIENLSRLVRIANEGGFGSDMAQELGRELQIARTKSAEFREAINRRQNLIKTLDGKTHFKERKSRTWLSKLSNKEHNDNSREALDKFEAHETKFLNTKVNGKFSLASLVDRMAAEADSINRFLRRVKNHGGEYVPPELEADLDKMRAHVSRTAKFAADIKASNNYLLLINEKFSAQERQVLEDHKANLNSFDKYISDVSSAFTSGLQKGMQEIKSQLQATDQALSQTSDYSLNLNPQVACQMHEARSSATEEILSFLRSGILLERDRQKISKQIQSNFNEQERVKQKFLSIIDGSRDAKHSPEIQILDARLDLARLTAEFQQHIPALKSLMDAAVNEGDFGSASYALFSLKLEMRYLASVPFSMRTKQLQRSLEESFQIISEYESRILSEPMGQQVAEIFRSEFETELPNACIVPPNFEVIP